MNILMAAEFFYPYAYGGSEWSIYTLAKALIQKGHSVVVLTPNYGVQSETRWKKIDIVRIPFFFRLHKYRRADISPIWFTNIVWWIISFTHLLTVAKKRNIDVIHVQGKYFLPAAFFVRIITGLPVVVTLRDYQVLCPFGFCLRRERNYKACGFKDLIMEDLVYHRQMYSPYRSPFIVGLQFIAAVRGKVASLLLKHFTNSMDICLCISNKQQHILRTNGVKKPLVIYNMVRFLSYSLKKNRNEILFVGRLTPGKGILVLLDSFEDLRKRFKVQLIIIGDGFLSKTIKRWISLKKMHNDVHLLGQRKYKETVNSMRKAKLVIVPSLWEEPFGRVALESLSVGTPVIASDRGALSEIVTNQKTGYVTSPTKNQLYNAISKGLTNQHKLRISLLRLRPDLQRKFFLTPLKKHLNLYTRLKGSRIL